MSGARVRSTGVLKSNSSGRVTRGSCTWHMLRYFLFCLPPTKPADNVGKDAPAVPTNATNQNTLGRNVNPSRCCITYVAAEPLYHGSLTTYRVCASYPGPGISAAVSARLTSADRKAWTKSAV